jgi:Flp pilus assembly protein TadG
MKFERQMGRFIIKFILGAVILVALCLAAFAYGQVVRGRGTGKPVSEAVRQAKDDAARQCAAYKGVEDVIITKQDCRDNGYCDVEIEATCKE